MEGVNEATEDEYPEEEVLSPKTDLIIRLTKAKFVQPNLAVAQGLVSLNNSMTTIPTGFKDEEPCQISLRSQSDVSRLQQYLNAFDAKLSTGKWCKVKESNPVFVKISTLLTTVIERNRHGTKLIECEDLLMIQTRLEDCIPASDNHPGPVSIHGSANFVMHDKKRRHTLFADWLIEKYGKEMLSTGSGILDVAGGKGELSYALLERGIPSVVLDPAPRLEQRDPKTIPVLARALEGDGHLLLEEVSSEEEYLIRTCSVICGMHPDQATEPIVLLAQRLKVPFALLPCCVMPSLFPKRMLEGQPVRSYRIFCQYLLTLQEGIQVDYLPFMGRNTILYTFQGNVKTCKGTT